MPEVFVDEAWGSCNAHDGAATPGDCGIYVLVGWVERERCHSFAEFA